MSKIRSTRIRPATPGDPAREVIDLARYAPFYIATISNTWSRGASKVYLARFGIGVLDWAMISTLAMEPRIQMQRLCEFSAADKAAVSRSVASLEGKDLVKADILGKDIRRRVLQLTPAGYDLHDQIIVLAQEREKILLHGLNDKDLTTLVILLNKLRENLSLLQGWDMENLSNFEND